MMKNLKFSNFTPQSIPHCGMAKQAKILGLGFVNMIPFYYEFLHITLYLALSTKDYKEKMR